MARRMSRSSRRMMKNVNRGADDVMVFVNENPLTSAFIALAAGAAATSAYKIATSAKPPAAPAAPAPKAAAQAVQKKPARKTSRKKTPAKAR